MVLFMFLVLSLAHVIVCFLASCRTVGVDGAADARPAGGVGGAADARPTKNNATFRPVSLLGFLVRVARWPRLRVAFVLGAPFGARRYERAPVANGQQVEKLGRVVAAALSSV